MERRRLKGAELTVLGLLLDKFRLRNMKAPTSMHALSLLASKILMMGKNIFSLIYSGLHILLAHTCGSLDITFSLPLPRQTGLLRPSQSLRYLVDVTEVMKMTIRFVRGTVSAHSHQLKPRPKRGLCLDRAVLGRCPCS